MLLCIVSVSFSSCSKDDSSFDYPMETLYGTWDGTAIGIDGQWIDITNYWYKEFEFSITFAEKGKYYADGYFGYGSGTYEASGKTIKTYVDGEYYRTYTIKSLTDNNAEVIMSVEGSEQTIGLKVKKR